VKNLIQTLTECPESEIPRFVEEVPEWSWPRGDIFLWIAVLNRFDDILDTLCKTHDMKKPHPKLFSEPDRRLTLAILYFSRLLLENCTNRNLYASYEVRIISNAISMLPYDFLGCFCEDQTSRY
jgi:E3 ubiquitin-protein ligase HUWE1